MSALSTAWMCLVALSTTARAVMGAPAPRPDVVLADFEGRDYGAWRTTGEAFGSGPAPGALPHQQAVSGFMGVGLVNSFHGGDDATGTLTSPPFRIERAFITFLIGGGGWWDETWLALKVDGTVARCATGANFDAGGSERLEASFWDVTEFSGRTGTLEIVDSRRGGWGHINVDHIVLSDDLPMSLARENLRIWTRSWQDLDVAADTPLVIPLRFHFVPAAWRQPGGGIGPATGTDQDTTAVGFDVDLEMTVGQATQLEIVLCGRALIWEAERHVLNGTIPWRTRQGQVQIRTIVDQTSCRVLAPDGRELVVTGAPGPSAQPELTITARGGDAMLKTAVVYGLRRAEPTAEEARLAAKAAVDDRVFYESASYTVYAGRVEDRVYGQPAASVPDPNTIVSPTRVIEGFVVDLDRWRPRPQGRVIDHHTIWHPHQGISRFPSIRTGWPSVDAACRVALDVLHRCSSDEFASSEADVGMWQAGFFMGAGAGFGIWTRDSTHVALRTGNLIDPSVARSTLIRMVRGGIDNGCDGVPMPIVGLWDYYLVTGDESAIRETWALLKGRIATIDAQFDDTLGLVRAAHSTSNDAFGEPEAGGFALGTETYFMLAYHAMAELGRIVNEDASQLEAWETRGEELRETIRRLYWKASAGFFTTGPEGSEGYERDYWESSGQELAIWPRFGIANQAQRRSVLRHLPQVAMNEFGVDVFPYRQEINHFCGAGWVVWSAGMAAAAGREGRLDILQQLIGQQVRNAVLHKTFYEVIDHRSGRAWRWPGQLWQAAGFLSYFYFGILGMEYDAAGLTLCPAVPEKLANLEITSLRYRQAVLDIRVKGWGMPGIVRLDGVQVDRIPAVLQGRHDIELVLQQPTERADR